MSDICFYFQVHQPERLRLYPVFDIGKNTGYFNDKKNREVMQKVARKCYLPTNKLMLDMIHEHDGAFKISYSITGTAIEQFEKYSPAVIDSFKALFDTGCVEFLSETYYHSLSFLYSKDEFSHQVKMHKDKMNELFGAKPQVFRNTELIYNNELAKFIEDKGYKGILAEGADHVMGWRSPNYLYRPVTTSKIKLLLKNYKLSDDIAFRFSNPSWEEHPLTAPKYAQWINDTPGEVVNLFMDYETFGEHQWSTTGIFKFLRQMPHEVLKNPYNSFKTPSEIVDLHEPVAELDCHNLISWADVERDLSAWRGNSMQDESLRNVYKIEAAVKESGDPVLISDWRKLLTSDHFYYMCTKWFADGDVHKYFNPYDSPYDGFIAFMNILNDISLRLPNRKLYNQPAQNVTRAIDMVA